MEKYRILFSTSATKALKKIPFDFVSKIVKLIMSLETNPYPTGCRKLSGEEATYRIRVGVYRIIYEVIKKEIVILVLKIGQRKDVYR